MSDVLITYREQNKLDTYYSKTAREQADLNDLVSMFIKELLTEKGSNVFDRSYGTTFMEDISGQVNIYKVEFFLDNNYAETYKKYGIVKVETKDVFKNVRTGFLDVRLRIVFRDFALEHYTSFLYNGTYTTETIIEMD